MRLGQTTGFSQLMQEAIHVNWVHTNVFPSTQKSRNKISLLYTHSRNMMPKTELTYITCPPRKVKLYCGFRNIDEYEEQTLTRQSNNIWVQKMFNKNLRHRK